MAGRFNIELRLLAGFAAGSIEGRLVYEAMQGETLDGLLGSSGISDAAPGFVLLNGRQAGPETVLSEGDVIAVFPPVGKPK